MLLILAVTSAARAERVRAHAIIMEASEFFICPNLMVFGMTLFKRLLHAIQQRTNTSALAALCERRKHRQSQTAPTERIYVRHSEQNDRARAQPQLAGD